MVPWAHQVLNPNGISIGAAVFAGLTSVTHRQTDHATRLVTTGRLYVCSTAMQPNNNNLIRIAPECQRLERRWHTESAKKN